MTDNTWDDHVILHGAANRFETCTDMTNSPPRHYDVMTCSNRLVLGHAHELHVRKKQITPGVRITIKRRLQTCGKPHCWKKTLYPS